MSDVNKLFKEACKDIDFSKEPTEAEQLQIEVAKRQYLERESLEAQLALSKKREEILRDALTALSKRHAFSALLGECICEAHVKARELIIKIDEAR
jgi:hypothetical protein